MTKTTNTTSWVIESDAEDASVGRTWASKYFAGTTMSVTLSYNEDIKEVCVQVMQEEYRGRKGYMKADDLFEAFTKANAWIKRHKIGQNV